MGGAGEHNHLPLNRELLSKSFVSFYPLCFVTMYSSTVVVYPLSTLLSSFSFSSHQDDAISGRQRCLIGADSSPTFSIGFPTLSICHHDLSFLSLSSPLFFHPLDGAKGTMATDTFPPFSFYIHQTALFASDANRYVSSYSFSLLFLKPPSIRSRSCD